MELKFDPPKGVIRAKYIEARDGENFPVQGICGPFGTAKTNMLIDYLMRRGFDYPGSNALLARATLKALRDSTLVRMNQRWGSLFTPEFGGGRNENQGTYTFPPAPDPVTGAPTSSTIRAIGLDRADLEHTLRSTEFATSAMEEADELPSDAVDMVQFRSRQQVFHRSKVVEDLCIKLSQEWGGLHPDLVHEILLADHRHPVGQGELARDHPMPGPILMKLAWNPTGDNDIWQRMVGLPYPSPRPTPSWVDAHVGIREIRSHYEEWHGEREIRLMAGVIVMLPDGSRRYVARHDDDNKMLYLVPDLKDPGAKVKVPEQDATVILQQDTIYVFGHENESRDFGNDIRSLLGKNKDLAAKFFVGKADGRSGRVFHNYIDDYVENGGHLIRYPGRKSDIAERRWPIVGGLDKGGRHAHATIMSIIAPESQRAVIYEEYVRTGIGAREHALDSKTLVLPGAPSVVWGYDPSLQAKRYDQDAEYATIEEYEDALAGNDLFPGLRGDDGFELVVRMLMRHAGNIDQKPLPKLLVFDHLKHVREAMLRLTWRMVDRERDNYLVDVGDAIKYMVSVMDRSGNAYDEIASDEMFRPKLAYRPR